MTTANTLIQGAMRSNALLRTGTSATAAELADGLELLNAMLGLWSMDGLAVPYRTEDNALAIGTSKQKYSIGSGGDFNTARPMRIEAATINIGDSRYPVAIVNERIYRAQTAGTSGIPGMLWYEPTMSTGTIYFDRKPATTYTLTLDSLKPFTEFATGATDITFPPGYDFVLRFNLAVYMASEYGREAPTSVQVAAAQGMDFLRTQNSVARTIYGKMDGAIAGVYNIVTDS